MDYDYDEKPRLDGNSELSQMYPKALSYEERKRRDEVYEKRRIANRPKFIAIRTSLLLSLFIAIFFAGLHVVANLAIIPAVFTAFGFALVLLFSYITAVSYVRALFSYHDKNGSIFLVMYALILFVALATMTMFDVLHFATILGWPLMTIGEIIIGHAMVVYVLAGSFVGFGRG